MATLADLMTYGRRQARDANGTKADAQLIAAANDALSMIAKACLWEYYKKHAQFSLDGVYTTGTVALTNGSTTVTLTGGTWPSWAASGKLVIGGKLYPVATRSSSSVVLLETAWKEATDSSESYRIYRDEYSLPSDCLKFGGMLPDQAWGGSINPVSYDAILSAQAAFTTSSRLPWSFSIHQSKVVLWPAPDQDRLLNYWYYYHPATLTSSSDTVDWDSLHTDLLHRAIDVQLCTMFPSIVSGNYEQCYARYLQALASAKEMDKGPAIMMPAGGQRSRRGAYHYRQLPTPS